MCCDTQIFFSESSFEMQTVYKIKVSLETPVFEQSATGMKPECVFTVNK